MPPAGAPLPEHKIHQHRQVAESFGSDAERYDRTRPRYPDAMVDRIIAVSPGPDVLDVGCGTGIAARQFHAAGGKVLGVEPDARMAEFARCGGVEVEVATFEAWDPAGRAFDAVIAGQAWHWVDPVAGAAKAAQVLRPGGRLAAFWHVFEPPPEVAEAFVAVYQRVMPDSPFNLQAMSKQALDGYQVLFTKAADGIREVGGFSDPEQWRFDWDRSYTREEWLDQLPTSGALTQLPSDKLAEVLAGVGAAIDAMGGSFTMHYTTVAVTAARTSPQPSTSKHRPTSPTGGHQPTNHQPSPSSRTGAPMSPSAVTIDASGPGRVG
jgi:SAM-dependent methyltransferase